MALTGIETSTCRFGNMFLSGHFVAVGNSGGRAEKN